MNSEFKRQTWMVWTNARTQSLLKLGRPAPEGWKLADISVNNRAFISFELHRSAPFFLMLIIALFTAWWRNAQSKNTWNFSLMSSKLSFVIIFNQSFPISCRRSRLFKGLLWPASICTESRSDAPIWVRQSSVAAPPWWQKHQLFKTHTRAPN